jgi:TPR repeat protein
MSTSFVPQSRFTFGKGAFLGVGILLWLALLPSLWGQKTDGDSSVEVETEREYVEALILLSKGDVESLKKAPRLLKKLAVSGHARSQDTLGSLYRQGLGVIQNDEQAVRWFTEAAEQRYPNSMMSLAESYMEGLGTKENYVKARALLEALLDPGAKFEVRIEEYGVMRRAKARASYLLGVIYSNGFDVEVDIGRSIELFETAAHMGDQDATMYLAITYAEGKKVEKSIDKAKEYFELLDLQSSDALRRSLDPSHIVSGDITDAENLREYGEVLNAEISQGILEMQTQFAKKILYSEGEDFDAEFAAGLLKLAANGEYAEAQSELGVLYYRGSGVEQDLENAVSLVADAAAQGWVIAQYNLAVIMGADDRFVDDRFDVGDLLELSAGQGLYAAQVVLDGENGPGVLNSEEAKDLCLEKANEKDARALFSLARRKMVGWMLDREEDRSKLVELIEASSNSGYSRAQYTMGMLYMTGEIVPQNVQAGFWLLKSAAAQDHSMALHHMGTCYAQGIVVEPNVEQAFRYFSRSAELGLDASKNSLAVFYNAGIYVIQNEWRASELYLEAADEGDPTAAFNIGNCYLEGKGVKRNVSKGLEWIGRSAEQGNLVACSQMSRIYEEGFLADFDGVEVAYWREKAADLGNRYSMKLTALNYFYGKGIPKNRGKATFWISEYMNQSGPIDTSRLTIEGEYEPHELVQSLLPQDYSALIVHADLLADPSWSGYDPDQAYRILEKLSSKGFLGARYRLADLHANQVFSKANPKKAYSLYKSLYDENRNADLAVRRVYAALASYELSGYVLEGVGTRPSESKGLKWLEVSAGSGYLVSQYEWGKRLVEGDGVHENLGEGIRWLIEAAKQGHLEARGELARLNLDRPIANLDEDTIIAWLKEWVDAGSGEARLLLREYGIEYKVPVRAPRAPDDGNKPDLDPYAPIEAA